MLRKVFYFQEHIGSKLREKQLEWKLNINERKDLLIYLSYLLQNQFLKFLKSLSEIDMSLVNEIAGLNWLKT